MADTETYGNVLYKHEKGRLTLTDKVFHFIADEPSKTSVKCSWARVEKRQLSPETSNNHMIKMILVSGKTAVFQVASRKILEELRGDCQARMTAAAERAMIEDPTPLRQSQRDAEAKMDRQRAQSVRVWKDESSGRNDVYDASQKQPAGRDRDDDNACCGWCCFNSTIAIFLCCLLCLVIAVTAFLIYWFVLKDTDAVNDVLRDTGLKGDDDRSRPPDVGEESKYGIRAVHHEWNTQDVKLKYQLSDYILDESVSFLIYDGLDCRRSDNDITKTNQYIFIQLTPPGDGGANLYNDGRGSRFFEVKLALNKGQITDAPFFTPNGLDAGRLSFCIGLSVAYNKVDYWEYTEEVNAVETAIQMDIDLSDFRRIDDVVIRTIIRPAYNRRELLTASSSSTSSFLRGAPSPLEQLPEEETEDWMVDETQQQQQLEQHSQQ